jgi:CubicO group peptidase (beta-lactamase class C family)
MKLNTLMNAKSEKGRSRKLSLCSILFIGLFLKIITITACAQSPLHLSNQQYLIEEQNVLRSTVLLNNSKQVIPLQNLEEKRIASINFTSAYASVFDSLLNKYAKIASFPSTAYNSGNVNYDDLNADLKFYNTIIIQVTDNSLNDLLVVDFIKDIQKSKEVIITFFGDVRVLNKLDGISVPIISSATKSEVSASFVAQSIFGGVAVSAKLAQNVSPKFRLGDGFSTVQTRLKYTVPEDVGINSTYLKPIDDIVEEAISERATPGAVVMVLKDGKVIFNKAYGNHTYDYTRPDRITDIFDIASITKISATTMAVMRLMEQGKLKLDTNIGAYVPKARNTNKNNIPVRQVMLHQAGFVPYIPFQDNIHAGDYSRNFSEAYPTKVADDYYIRKGYFDDVMWPKMLNSHLETRGKYVYSDLSMYFMKEIVERQSEEHLETYVASQFYNPLGMQTAGFLPRNRFSKDQIVPTEVDTYFRKTTLQGFVHDQGAALTGGVSGHAGLFASTNDLAILFQMLLNRGSYGGLQYFKPETVDMYTAKQSNVSRRGLGFDRYDEDLPLGYPSKSASPQTYGHTGYTGTCVWVDPKQNLVYIFLSNRVYPRVTDKLSQLRIRPRIQDAIYEAIRKSGN